MNVQDLMQRFAVLEVNFQNSQSDLKEIKQELDVALAKVETLERWQSKCNWLAAAWGSVCMTAVGSSAWVISNWHEIKAFFGPVGKQ